MTRTAKFVLMSLTFIVICFSSANSVQADPVTLFTDRAAFNAASTNLQVITFNDINPPGVIYNSFGTASGLLQNGVRFVGNAGAEGFNLTVVSANEPSGLYNWNSGAVLLGPFQGERAPVSIDVTLPSGITAVGSDIMSIISQTPSPFEITVFAGGHAHIFTVATFTQPNRAFAGFISDVSITSLRFRTVNTTADPLLDNFTFGQAITQEPGPGPAPVPEPTTMLLLGTGLAGVIGATRRRRKARDDGGEV